MLKKIYGICLLILLGLASCVDNDGIGMKNEVSVLRFDFPQGNDPWDKEIEQIAKDWDMYIVYKNVDSTHLNRMWTTPFYNDPIYVCTTPSSDQIQEYLYLVKTWLLGSLDKENEADRHQLPFYLYLVNDLKNGNPRSQSYGKHIQFKQDGLDYWSLSFASEEWAVGLTPKIIHGVACAFSYPGLKSRVLKGEYKVAPGFELISNYESPIGFDNYTFEEFINDYGEGYGQAEYEQFIHPAERDPVNYYKRRGFAPQITEAFVQLNGFPSYGAPLWMPWIVQIMDFPWGPVIMDRHPDPSAILDDVSERVKQDFLNMIRVAMLYSETKIREKFPLDPEDPLDQAGNQMINAKYDLVVKYMKTTYGVDLKKYAAILDE